MPARRKSLIRNLSGLEGQPSSLEHTLPPAPTDTLTPPGAWSTLHTRSERTLPSAPGSRPASLLVIEPAALEADDPLPGEGVVGQPSKSRPAPLTIAALSALNPVVIPPSPSAASNLSNPPLSRTFGNLSSVVANSSKVPSADTFSFAQPRALASRKSLARTNSYRSSRTRNASSDSDSDQEFLSGQEDSTESDDSESTGGVRGTGVISGKKSKSLRSVNKSLRSARSSRSNRLSAAYKASRSAATSVQGSTAHNSDEEAEDDDVPLVPAPVAEPLTREEQHYLNKIYIW